MKNKIAATKGLVMAINIYFNKQGLLTLEGAEARSVFFIFGSLLTKSLTCKNSCECQVCCNFYIDHYTVNTSCSFL